MPPPHTHTRAAQTAQRLQNLTLGRVFNLHRAAGRVLSQEKAAQIAGLDRTDFLLALVREGIDVFQVDFEDLDSELELA